MSLHEAILSALDPLPGTRYSDEDATNMAGALRDLLAACERADESWGLTIHPGPKPGAPQSMSTPTEAWLPTEGIRNLIARALGVSTEPAQPTVADLDNCPHGKPWGTCKEAHRGDRCQCNPRRDLCNCDGTVIENCPCYKHLLMPPWPPAEVVPAQAEPRVWRVTQTPRGNRVPVHIDYAVIDGAWSIRSDRTGWRPSEDFGGLEAMQRAGYVLSEVTGQEGDTDG